jgi:hypothetical protein
MALAKLLLLQAQLALTEDAFRAVLHGDLHQMINQKHAGLAAFLQLFESLNWKIMENGNWLSSSMTAAMLPG